MHRAFQALLLVLSVFLITSSSIEAEGLDGIVPVLDSALADSMTLDGQVVYLDFWASWCLPCRKAFPWMSNLQTKYRDRGLRVVAVNLDRERKAAESFLEKTGTPVSVIYDPKGYFAKRTGLEVMPTSFIFDRGAKVQRTNLGFATEDTLEIEQFILSLLNATEPK